MKILSIRLKNLASIEGEFEIDFTAEPLASAGIFAISGPTGAGKSTILDALCLALYDKMPRFATSGESLFLKDVGDSQVNQSDVKNILRRGAGEGFAEVDFLGADGHQYRSRWSVRRARGKAVGSLQAQTMQVVNLNTGVELQGTKTEILNQLVVRVGLTYDQFTRTVLLAQNDFATFLKSRESAKAELLEKLTGTEIYSQISRAVYAHSKQAMEEFTHLQRNISLIELLSEEELKALQKEKIDLDAQRNTATQLLMQLNEELKIVTSLKVQQELLTKKRSEESTQMALLKGIQAQYAQDAEKMAQFKLQCEALQPELRKARELDTRIHTIQTHFAQVEQTYTLARKRKEEAVKGLSAKETALINELRKLNTSKQDGATLSYEDRLQQAGELQKEYEQQLRNFQQANNERLAQLNAYGIQALGNEQQRLVHTQQQLQTTRQLTVEWLMQQKEEARLTEESSKLNATLVIEEKELNTLKEQLTAKQSLVQSLQRVYDNARMAISKDVETIRHHLTPDQPCPVCGATIHPYAQSERVVDAVFQQIEKEYNVVFEEQQQLNNRCVASEEHLRHIQTQRMQLATQLATIQNEVERKRPKKEEECTLNYFDTQLATLQRQLNEISEKLQAYQRLYEEWQVCEKKIHTLRQASSVLQETIASCKLLLQQVASAKEQIATATTNEVEESKRFTQVSKDIAELRTARAALLKGKTADDAEAAVQRHEKELNDILENARKEVELHTTRLSGVQGEIKQLYAVVEELSNAQQQIEFPEQLPVTIAAHQEASQEIERKLSLVEAKLLQQEQNRIKLKGIEKALKEKQAEAEQWEKLNKLIGSADGTKFKVIAQSYTLNLLLMHANTHLSYLSKRYKLQQVPDTLALQVIDCDMCDEVRTVYSLSGGESFLISLALALGLSSLSSHNLKVESLFIDEGFGSLDAESLRTAMEALEQLQMQGRKIGVISHVQEMSERIPVQIQIHKSVNGKSRIDINKG